MPRKASRLMRLAILSALLPAAFGQCPAPTWSPGDRLGSGLDPWGWVFALTVYQGDLVAGGYFTTAGGVTVNQIARWNGTSWQSFGAGMDGPVWAFAEYNGQLIAGGAFTTAGGTSANGIARWDGSSWQPLGSGTDLQVLDLAVYGTQLIAGGNFSSAGGVSTGPIAAWNGSSWQALGTGLAGDVYALAVYNGQLAAGGAFPDSVALWNGSAWGTFGPGVAGRLTYDLAVYNGELIAAGIYLDPPPFPIQHSFVLRSSGSAWQTLGTGIDGYQVNSVGVHGGELVAGGSFGLAGGMPAGNIAAWNGGSWQTFAGGVDDAVRSLGSYNGALIVGGHFLTAGTQPSTYIARWSSPLPLLSLTQPGGPTTGVLVTDSAVVAGHEYFNVVSFDLCPGGVGTGPYGGLCFSDLSCLAAQIQLPVGSHPFHFLAPGTAVAFGPYALPSGLTFEALGADVTGGVLGCISPVIRYTVQ